MKHFLPILLMTAGLFSASSLSATHVMGGDLTFRCVGQDSFMVTLKVFRDCVGASLGNTQTLRYNSAICGQSGQMSLTKIDSLSAIDITPLCPGDSSACNGGGGAFGVEQYIYEGLVVMPAKCPDWRLNWTLCCRNHKITTLNNPGGESMYVEALLNNTNSIGQCNSSPSFVNPPVPFTCKNMKTSYNHGVTDPDGDSLVFILVPCYDDAGKPVVYETGFNALQPLKTTQPIKLDSLTGTLVFTPSEEQVGVLCILVEEYRNGTKIGSVVRDIQITVRDCENEPPTAGPMDGQDYDTVVCPGQFLEFEIFTNDLNPTNNLTMSWNGGIPNATFVVTPGQHPKAVFTWQTTPQDVGFYFFTVTVQDDTCPVIGTNIFSYQIEVRPTKLDVGPDATICPGDTVVPQATWKIFDNFQWSPVYNMTDSSDPLTNLYPIVTTEYVLHAWAGQCTDEDTLTVHVIGTPSHITSSADSSICQGETAELTAFPPGAAYNWSTGHSSNSIFVNTGGWYFVTITGANGCVAKDSFKLVQSPFVAPTVDAGTDSIVICLGNGFTLGGNPVVTGGLAPFAYAWNPPAGLSNHLIPHPLANPSSSRDYVLAVTDSNGCVGADIIHVEVADRPHADAGPDIDVCMGDDGQLGGSPTASMGTPPYSFSWSPVNNLSNTTASNPIASVLSQQQYVVMLTDANGCVNWDTVVITPYDAPMVDAGPDRFVCQNESVAIGGNPTAAGPRPPFSYLWSPGGSNVANPQITATNPTTYYLEVVDGAGCIVKDTMTVHVKPAPVADFSYQAQQLHVDFMDASSGAIATWDWDFGDNNSSQVQNPSHAYFFTGSYTVCLTVVNIDGCSHQVCEAIDVSDSVSSVSMMNGYQLRLFPNPVSNGQFFLQYEGPTDGLNWEVMDLSGRVLRSGSWLGNLALVEASEWPQGTYLVRVSGSNEHMTMPVMIAR